MSTVDKIWQIVKLNRLKFSFLFYLLLCFFYNSPLHIPVHFNYINIETSNRHITLLSNVYKVGKYVSERENEKRERER